MIRKNIFILAVIFAVGCTGLVFGQQDPQYSQYMFNGLAYNPAYAGSRDALSATLLMRKQWVQLNGSPLTGSLALHGPSRNERHGFGLSIEHDR